MNHVNSGRVLYCSGTFYSFYEASIINVFSILFSIELFLFQYHSTVVFQLNARSLPRTVDYELWRSPKVAPGTWRVPFEIEPDVWKSIAAELIMLYFFLAQGWILNRWIKRAYTTHRTQLVRDIRTSSAPNYPNIFRSRNVLGFFSMFVVQRTCFCWPTADGRVSPQSSAASTTPRHAMV